MDICEHHEQKSYKRGIWKSAKTEIKPGSQEKFYVGKYNRYWIKHIGAHIRTLFIVWKLALPHYVVRSILRKVHKLIEHAVAKEREMINNDDGREDSEGKFWCAPWGERAAILSFQTGICSNIGHGLIVWWSRYLDRGGDQETSKGACFLALEIRKISSPSADNAAAQNTEIKRTTSFIYGHGEPSKQSKRIRNPIFTENKIIKNFSKSSLSFLLASINRSYRRSLKCSG